MLSEQNIYKKAAVVYNSIKYLIRRTLKNQSSHFKYPTLKSDMSNFNTCMQNVYFNLLVTEIRYKFKNREKSGKSNKIDTNG